MTTTTTTTTKSVKVVTVSLPIRPSSPPYECMEALNEMPQASSNETVGSGESVKRRRIDVRTIHMFDPVRVRDSTRKVDRFELLHQYNTLLPPILDIASKGIHHPGVHDKNHTGIDSQDPVKVCAAIRQRAIARQYSQAVVRNLIIQTEETIMRIRELNKLYATQNGLQNIRYREVETSATSLDTNNVSSQGHTIERGRVDVSLASVPHSQPLKQKNKGPRKWLEDEENVLMAFVKEEGLQGLETASKRLYRSYGSVQARYFEIRKRRRSEKRLSSAKPSAAVVAIGKT